MRTHIPGVYSCLWIISQRYPCMTGLLLSSHNQHSRQLKNTTTIYIYIYSIKYLDEAIQFQLDYGILICESNNAFLGIDLTFICLYILGIDLTFICLYILGIDLTFICLYILGIYLTFICLYILGIDLLSQQHTEHSAYFRNLFIEHIMVIIYRSI